MRHLIRVAVVTALVGLSGGVAGIAVYAALHLIQVVVLGYPWHTSLEAGDNPSAIGRFAVLTGAGIVVAFAWWALRRWAKQVVSVPKAIEGSRMPAFTTLANAGIQVLAVGLGASVGKEVAPREIAAWLAQQVTRHAGLTARETKILVACGSATGLAAVYNAPLAGALFAIEVLLGEISFATALPAFATSAIGAFVARAVVPVETLYAVPRVTMSPSLVAWSIIVGPVVGLAAVGFVAVANRAQRGAPRGWRILVVLPVVFAIVGAIAIVMPEVLGNGRVASLAAMRSSIDGHTMLGMAPIVFMLVLAVVKSATTAGTLGSGAVGGTLAPSVAIGSALGAGLGGLWLLLWPGSGLSAFAFVGAAAFLATTMRAPFTALLLVVEFTNQGTSIFIPALLAVSGAVAVGYALSRRRLATPETVPPRPEAVRVRS